VPLLTFILFLALQLQPTPTTTPVPITLGHSTLPLNAPWKFQTGDNPNYADPNFDDSTWETVDLTPPENSHDADVGLSNYVSGWTAKGHPNYSGYAWYRLHLTIEAPANETLSVACPADVDDAYQLFINGQLQGGAGDFTHATPIILSVQPKKFPLPSAAQANATNTREITIAIRVWMSPDSLVGNPDAGGIHIAPLIGTASAIDARYQIQWLETFRGYVVDAVESLAFVLLAILAIALIPSELDAPTYRWLAIALIASAIVRANQAFFSWTQLESLRTFTLLKEVILIPAILAAWTITWCNWFEVKTPRWIPRAAAILCAIYFAAQFILWLSAPRTNAALNALATISTLTRLAFAAILIFILFAAAKKIGPRSWPDVTAAVLISIGLFAQELSTLHVPSIWFPFNTGVSRTQFAYAAFIIVLFALLLRRISSLRVPHPSPPSRRVGI
jgi:hypothetical protein